MRYAKLIDGKPVYAPNPIIVDGARIGNPPPEVYTSEGYKPVVYTEPPGVDTGYIAVEGWIEDSGSIVQTWTVEEEPDEIGGERAAEIMFGG